jgi:hypothetical protein
MPNTTQTLNTTRWRFTPQGVECQVGLYRVNVRRMPGGARYQWAVRLLGTTHARGYEKSQDKAKVAGYAEARAIEARDK